MLLDISRVRRGAEEVNRRYEPEAFAGLESFVGLQNEFRVTGVTTITGTAKRDTGTAVVLAVRVASTLEMACSRCLEAFDVPVDAAVETRFVPAGDLAKVTAETVRSGEIEDDIEEHDLGLAEYRDETIDLGDVMKEQFVLALPMKPLCKDDCQGLCPVCGVNRNRESCECRQEWVDPRLAALAELKKQ
jgi:uncharacterized protein